MRIRVMLWVGLALALAACQFGNINVQLNADGSTNITISLSEAEANALVQNALAQTGNPLLRDPRIDLQPGKIVISGTHDRRDGGGAVAGTVDMTFSVANGQVTPQISAVNIEGLQLDDERIRLLNQRLAEALTQRASRDNRQAAITGITVTNDQLQLTLTVRSR